MPGTSGLTGGGRDTEGQKSSSSFTPFLEEPSINNGSFLFMEMQNRKKGRACQWLERPATLVSSVWGTFHRKKILRVLLAIFSDLLKYMFNTNR